MDKIILASQSPRRRQLMEAAEIPFDIIVADVDETPPPGVDPSDVPELLAVKKAAVVAESHPQATIVAADTIVLLDGVILGKPAHESEARDMLQKIQGRSHEVITGVCLQRGNKQIGFSVKTTVYFRPLTHTQINHYVQQYRPFDKAGAYAIQEWIGMIAIERIEGDYYNVMGLPIGEVVIRLALM